MRLYTEKGLTAIFYHPYGPQYPYPNYVNRPMYCCGGGQHGYWHSPSYGGQVNSYPNPHGQAISLADHGPKPFVVDINQAAKQNHAFRTALWTGPNLQMTLMSLNVGEDVGLEMHSEFDQFLRVEQGAGIVQMGNSPNHLDYQREIGDDYAIFIPAGTWHNLTNTGNVPLKLYSIYAPPAHPHGTVHTTKKEAMEAEEEYGH